IGRWIGKRGGTGRQLAPPMIEGHPQRDPRKEGVEGPGALEPEPRQRAFLDQLHPELLLEIGGVESGRSARHTREDLEKPAVELVKQLRPGRSLASRATVDELPVTHGAIPSRRALDVIGTLTDLDRKSVV